MRVKHSCWKKPFRIPQNRNKEYHRYIVYILLYTIMSSKCVNSDCTSSPLEHLKRATWSICSYYSVQFKPYHRVCENCFKKCDQYHCRLQKTIINQQCLFDISTESKPDLVDLTDDSTDIPTIPVIQTVQEQQLASLTNTILSDMKPLIQKQFTLCKNHVIKLIEKKEEGEQCIHKKLKELDKELDALHKTIYRCDNIQYEHEPEVNISNLSEVPVIILHKKLLNPKDLPSKGLLARHEIKQGDKVFANKFSGSLPWVEGTTVGNIIIASYGDANFSIKFSDDESILDFSLKELAYKDASEVQYEVGTRVIAKFHDTNPSMTNNFYAGIVAETPKELNSYRYLIFFDDGYAQYAYHKEVRLVCYQSLDVSADVDSNSREFIKSYLQKYPERLMVKFSINQKVRTDYEGRWHNAKVVNIDASLVQLKFIDTEHEHIEWIYRGSNRLELVYHREMSSLKSCTRPAVLTKIKKTLNKPYVELEYEANKEVLVKNDKYQPVALEDSGVIKTIEIPPNSPQPISFKDHECNYFCLLRVTYNADQTTTFNTLSIPLHYGFQRYVMKTKNLEPKVMYITPCGRKIHNENEMYSFLKKTFTQNHHCMSIEMFNFDYFVNPLNLYNVPMFLTFKDDISGGLESKPISAVNCFDKSMPPEVKYITKRMIRTNVIINWDPQFLICCDCTDNCENKKKCPCWQQTINGRKHNLRSIGYQFKRLYERVDTGIFECNTNCKCSTTCLNRVVQQPLSAMLQVFKTKNKGWGLRTLADIPKGSFICNYIGEIYKENDAEMIALNTGDVGEYFSNLDYVEMVLELKDGYENDVVNPPDEESDSVALFNLKNKEDLRSNIDLIKTNYLNSIMGLRNKNIQHSSTEINGKHKLSKLNSQQSSISEISDITFYRQYFDKDAGIYVVDAKYSGNMGRYFNHSCDPNVFVQNVFVDTHDLRFPWQAYFASCFIPSGTELVYDYGYEVGSVNGLTVYCHCGSKDCKGRLL